METVELLVFMGISVLLGGLIITFITDLTRSNAIGSTVTAVFTGEEARNQAIQPVEAENLAGQLFQTWKACGYGSKQLTKTYNLKEEHDMTEMYADVKKQNLCRSMPSNALGCGEGEAITLTDGTLIQPTSYNTYTFPENSILTVSCDPTAQKLRVEVT